MAAARKPFLQELKKQANDDAVGSNQVDVSFFLVALDAIIANPNITTRELIAKVEARTWAGGFVRGMRQTGISAARLLNTPIPK